MPQGRFWQIELRHFLSAYVCEEKEALKTFGYCCELLILILESIIPIITIADIINLRHSSMGA